MKYNIERFIKIQKEDYAMALKEIKNGRKRTHWMWYIFPQLKGLGTSAMAQYYGLENLEEAKEYYNNDYLRKNLLEITKALLSLDNTNIESILGYPDNLKLLSCMTLFEIVDKNENVFSQILDKYYKGKRDTNTIHLIK